MPDQEDSRRTCLAGEGRDDGVAQPAGRVGPVFHGGAQSGQEFARPTTDLVDAGRGVTAAIGVDESLEVGEERRQIGSHGRLELRELVDGWGDGRGVHADAV